MDGLDLVLFNYNKGVFSCQDDFAAGYNVVSDVSKGGRNDVSFVSGKMTMLDAVFAPYTTLLTWTCTKDISNVDSNDWAKFSTWQTNTGSVTGAWNYLSRDGVPMQHQGNPKMLKIIDGSGLSVIVPTSSAGFTSVSLCLLFILSLLI